MTIKAIAAAMLLASAPFFAATASSTEAPGPAIGDFQSAPTQAGTIALVDYQGTGHKPFFAYVARRGGVAYRGGAYRGGAYRRGVAVGPRGGVAYRRGVAVGPRGGVYRGGAAVAVRRPVLVGGVYRPNGAWWRPGGAIAAGAAIGFVTAATAAVWAGAPPAGGYCWYYTDPSRTSGFWDVCP
jgi:hypothetical protein